MEKGYLVLQDGRVFEGVRFGAAADAVGEMVFNTSAGSFIEIMTDPACAGQIVMQTYPLIGNYGVIRADAEGPCAMRGYVVRECCEAPSNFRTDCDLDTYLKEQGVPGLAGVDTRELTRILREEGVMNAMICSEVPADLTALQTYAVTGAMKAVTRKETAVYPAENEVFKVTLVDCGAKASFIKALCAAGCTVTAVSAFASAEEIVAANPDGVILSAGPGDPAENTALIETVKTLLGKVPVMGVGLGHQILALAAGGTAMKLKYGHHGANQAVRDLKGGRTYTTTQNHLYAVDPAGITEGEMSFVNVNDGSCEGMDYPAWKAFGVQFEPILCTGSRDEMMLINRFKELMKGGAN